MGAGLTDKCEMKRLVSERRQRTEKGSSISNVFQLVILPNDASIAIGDDFSFQNFQEFIRTCHEHFPLSCLRCEKQLWNSDVLIIDPNTRVYRREASSFKPLDQMFSFFLLLPLVSLPRENPCGQCTTQGQDAEFHNRLSQGLKDVRGFINSLSIVTAQRCQPVCVCKCARHCNGHVHTCVCAQNMCASVPMHM